MFELISSFSFFFNIELGGAGGAAIALLDVGVVVCVSEKKQVVKCGKQKTSLLGWDCNMRQIKNKGALPWMGFQIFAKCCPQLTKSVDSEHNERNSVGTKRTSRLVDSLSHHVGSNMLRCSKIKRPHYSYQTFFTLAELNNKIRTNLQFLQTTSKPSKPVFCRTPLLYTPEN